MASAEKVYVIGIGENGLDGLTAAARELIHSAQLLVGEAHELAQVPECGAERLVISNQLDEAVSKLREVLGTRRTVVLASGDPLFYGVARYLCDRLGKENFEVVPHVSSMQLAFARVKESWEDAFLTNLAHYPLENVLEQIRGAEKVGLFTTEQYTPAVIARTLLEHQLDYFTAYVCENLGSPDERVTHGELAEIASHEYSPLNVMILVRKPLAPDRPSHAIGRRLFGNLDEAFLQSKPKRGLLTPAEIRAIALAEMDIGPASVVWDVGAGSGSVAIEAAQLAPQGKVYAIEQDAEDHQLILDNAKRFGVTNLVAVLGRAPEAWKDLPQPDAVFVGGSGRGISQLVVGAYERLRPGGRLAATIGSIDNLAETHQALHKLCGHLNVLMVNLARGNYHFDRLRFTALNPVFVLSAAKPQR